LEEITVVDIPELKVLGIRKRGKYQMIAELLPQLFQYAVEKGARIQGPPMFVCHETGVDEVMKADKEGNADVEVAVPVGGEIEGTDEIKYYTLPGGKMAKIIHKGPYEACEPAYKKLFAWIEEKGNKIIGPTREVYLNDPREVGQEEILTEIYAPIE
jgi:effector-binding domain-containing protein